MLASSIRAWLPPILVGAGISALVGSVAGIATMAGWMPPLGTPAADRAAARAGAPPLLGHVLAPSDGTCATCGVVESVRAVQGGRDVNRGRDAVVRRAPDEKQMSYRVTVRMDDGSYRTLPHAAPPAVAVGDPVRVAEGTVVARH